MRLCLWPSLFLISLIFNISPMSTSRSQKSLVWGCWFALRTFVHACPTRPVCLLAPPSLPIPHPLLHSRNYTMKWPALSLKDGNLVPIVR